MEQNEAVMESNDEMINPNNAVNQNQPNVSFSVISFFHLRELVGL